MSVEPKKGAWAEAMDKDDRDDYSETKRLRQQVHDYADATSIHGIKYVGEKDRTWCER